MNELITQVLKNQILIMEVLRRTTRYPHWGEEMEDAIEETNDLIKQQKS